MKFSKYLSVIFLALAFCIYSAEAFAQPISYSGQNAHSHNDYNNASPFHTAYNAGFGSIEVDVLPDERC